MTSEKSMFEIGGCEEFDIFGHRDERLCRRMESEWQISVWRDLNSVVRYCTYVSKNWLT